MPRGIKIVFWIVAALSLVIVVGYAALSLVARPPENEAEGPVVPPAVVTDDPSTPEDESQGSAAEETRQLHRRQECYTFLLMGSDDGNGNADTIMVATYHVPDHRVSVVSIPRDTLVNVPRKVKKINAAYGAGGVEEVMKEASALLGFPVEHYIVVDLRAFEAIVDTVGGVDFNVPIDMYYWDPTQDLTINLLAGWQHLDGDKALQLVRFRSGYQNADIGRINTQQQFLKALGKRVLSFKSLTKIGDFVEIFAAYVRTDLTVGNLMYFASQALELDLERDVTLRTLPGNGMVSYQGIDYYYELYPGEVLTMINDGMNPYEEAITPEMTDVFQVP